MSHNKMPDHLRALDGKTVEFISDVVKINVEKLADKKYRFQTVGSIANVLNGNNRIIPFIVQNDAVTDWQAGKWQLTSYLGHPDPAADPRGKEDDLAGIPEILNLNDKGETVVNIRLIDTEKGRKVQTLFDESVELGVSQRALGVQSVREDEGGNYYIVVDKIVKILGYDFCYLETAAAGERTRLRLVDTVELSTILKYKRIEDTLQEDSSMEKLIEQNKLLVASVTALVDTIQKQMTAATATMPQAITDSFGALKTGVETLVADTSIDPEKKNANLVKLSGELKTLVDSITPAPVVPEVVVPVVEAPAVVVVDTKASEAALAVLTDSARRLTEFVENSKREADLVAKTAAIGTYLVDSITRLEQPADAKTVMTDSLKGRAFADNAAVDAAIQDAVKLYNLGVAQEKQAQEGLKAKGTSVMDITVVGEHLKGVEIIADQIVGTGFINTKKEAVVLGKDRSAINQQLLRVFDKTYGAYLKKEADMIVALQDATQTPADFQIPYTISRIVLAEVYADQMIERLTLFGPMDAKRDQIPITRYRREGGIAGTRKTYKPSTRRQNDLKVAEFGVMAKGKLTTEWFPIDATASKLQAQFSDEFATLSKRYANITGISQGIANLIADLKRSLQQMVFANMRNSALAYGSVAFSFTETVDVAKSEFTVVSGASISVGETLSVAIDTVAVHEYEVSSIPVGDKFYVVDGLNGKIQFVDATGAASPVAHSGVVLVTGKKATNEIRFSLGGVGTKEWSKYMNELLFKVQNQAASHRQSRGYKPDFILASEVTSNYLTQAEAYEPARARAGYSAGQVLGEGNYGITAGLSHFGSDVWDDAYILLSQKDATIFRIWEPLVLKGPYPVRNSDAQLVGGDEYYIYQEDALSTPINDKMSLVTVTA